MKTEPPTSKIRITDYAREKIDFMRKNDFTLADKKYLRIQIQGKGCSGFEYGVGLSDEIRENDQVIPYDENLSIRLDSFTSFYVRNATLDYIFDPENDLDGWIFTNEDEHLFQDKFWKNNPQLKPAK